MLSQLKLANKIKKNTIHVYEEEGLLNKILLSLSLLFIS